jgi:rhodanese-related sulfurtransferase
MQEYFDFVAKEWPLFALLAVIIALFIGTEIMRKMRGSHSISVADALNLFNNEDAVLVDVQELEEFRNGHLPQARNMPLSLLENKVGELKFKKDRPVVVYCKSGNRAAGACNTLKKQGFENVRSLAGGLMAWQSANLPVAKGKK